MKRNQILIPLVSMLVLGSSCTKNFEEYNTNPYGLTKDELNYDFKLIGDPMKQAIMNIYVVTPAWNTQLQQNLMGDIYSGYMASPTAFNGNSNNSTYYLMDGWNTYPWDDGYNYVMANTKSVIENATASENLDYVAWAKIVRVEAMHRVSDIYGPIIYSKYGTVNSDGSVDYDSQKDVYYAFFDDLKSAIDYLTPLAQAGESFANTTFDPVYGGSYTKWVKFANTLRLRLALRISGVDPTKAQSEGEAALSNPVGLITSSDDNFNVSTGTFSHPLNTISGSWGDIGMGAPMESYLNGYNDPRVAYYFKPATDPTVTGQYKGIRQGINIDAKGRYGSFSMLTDFSNYVLLMTAAESWFLKAEAALKGWSGAGVAQDNYEAGIKASFTQYGLSESSANAYINDASSQPIPYVDPKAITAGANNINTGSPYLSTATIKWDAAATDAVKLEKIITQKWIAMYPDGQEAWSEFRRTGYPKLFPVVVNLSGGVIGTGSTYAGKFIRRINFALSERNTNPTGVTQATTLLGGPDNGATPLWWDVH